MWKNSMDWESLLYLVPLVILVALFLRAACAPPQMENANANANETAAQLKYGQDPRTGLCYAVTKYTGYGFTGLAITQVPCTSEVRKLVER